MPDVPTWPRRKRSLLLQSIDVRRRFRRRRCCCCCCCCCWYMLLLLLVHVVCQYMTAVHGDRWQQTAVEAEQAVAAAEQREKEAATAAQAAASASFAAEAEAEELTSLVKQLQVVMPLCTHTQAKHYFRHACSESPLYTQYRSHSLTHSPVHSPTHSLTHLLTCPLARSLTHYSLARSLAHSLTCPLAHPLTSCPCKDFCSIAHPELVQADSCVIAHSDDSAILKPCM